LDSSHFLSQFISDWRNANILGVKIALFSKWPVQFLRRSQEFNVVSRTNNVLFSTCTTNNVVVSTHSH